MAEKPKKVMNTMAAVLPIACTSVLNLSTICCGSTCSMPPAMNHSSSSTLAIVTMI